MYPYLCLDVRSPYMYPTRVDGELNAETWYYGMHATRDGS